MDSLNFDDLIPQQPSGGDLSFDDLIPEKPAEVSEPIGVRALNAIGDTISNWGVLTPEEAEAEKKDRLERARQQELWAKQQRADIESRMGADYIPGQTLQETQAQEARDVAEGPAPTKSAGRSAAEGFVRETGRGLVALGEAPGIAADFVDWAATGDSNESGYTKALRGYSDAIAKALPGDPTRRGELIDQLGGGGGSMTSMLVGSAALRIAGVPLKAGQYYAGMSQSGVQGYEDAESKDASPGKKYASFFLNAGLGATEAIPISRAFDRLDDASGGKVSQILANSTANSLEEFIQELGQGLGSNFIANTLAGYDPERATTEGVAEQAAVGFILGGVMGAGTTALSSGPEQVTEKGASQEQTAALTSNDVKGSSTAQVDPAVAQAVAGEAVTPGQTPKASAVIERARQIAEQRAAAASAAAPTAESNSAAPAQPPAAEQTQPVVSPTTESATEPPAAGVVADPAAPTKPKWTNYGEVLTKPKGSHYFIGPFGFSFERRGNGRYLWLTADRPVFQSRDGGDPDATTTHVWGFEDPNQGDPRQGAKVGINSLENNVPPDLIPVFRDWLEGKIDDDVALERIKATERSGATPPAEQPAAEDPVQTATNLAEQWDRANRSSRSDAWFENGTALSNPAFEAVEAEGSRVPAHGMSKSATLGKAFQDLMELVGGSGNAGLYTAPLTAPRGGSTGATASGTAYRDGPFIITFREGVTDTSPQNITGILVNPAHPELVTPLQQMFPNLAVRTFGDVADVIAASRSKAPAEAEAPPPSRPNFYADSPETIKLQHSALLDPKNDRKVVMYSSEMKLGELPDKPKPAYIKRYQFKVDGKTVYFDVNTAKTNYGEVQKAVRTGKLNELLDLGPYDMQQVAASAATGAPSVAVVERTPDGTEVKAAAGTAKTAAVQKKVLERTKSSPENTVTVDDPQAVINDRRAASGVRKVDPNTLSDEERARLGITPRAAPGGKRILEDLSPEGKAKKAAAEKAEAARVAAQIKKDKDKAEAELREAESETKREEVKGKAEKGEYATVEDEADARLDIGNTNWESNERAAARTAARITKDVFDIAVPNMPEVVENNSIAQMASFLRQAMALGSARFTDATKAAKENGAKLSEKGEAFLKIRKKAGYDTVTGHGVWLAEAKRMLRRAENIPQSEAKRKELLSDLNAFISATEALKVGDDSQIRNLRQEGNAGLERTESSDNDRKDFDQEIAQASAGDDEKSAVRAEEDAAGRTYSGEVNDAEANDALAKADITTGQSTRVRRDEPVEEGTDYNVGAKPIEKVKVEKVKKRTIKRLMRDSSGVAAKEETVLPLDESKVISRHTLADALNRLSTVRGNYLNQLIINRVLKRLREKVGDTRIKIVEQSTLDAMYPDRRPGQVDGFYEPSTGEIILSANFLKNGKFDRRIIAHEGIHAFLQTTIDTNEELTKDIQEILDHVTKVFADRGITEKSKVYGLKDVHEFLSEALSNPDFQNELMSIRLPARMASKFDAPQGSIWSALVTAVRKALGLGNDRKTVDALSYALRLVDRADELEGKSGQASLERGMRSKGYLSENAPQPVFYSALTRAVEGFQQGKAAAGQWLGRIRNTPGVKPDEIEWVGLEDWLNAQDGPVTKQQVLEYLAANQLEVSEVKQGERDVSVSDETRASVQAWIKKRLKGEERKFALSYEKVIFNDKRDADLRKFGIQHLGHIGVPAKFMAEYKNYFNSAVPQWSMLALPGGSNYRTLLITLPGTRGEYKHRMHWDEKNVVAHIRFDERTDAQGRKVLFIHEVQSDWHQEAGKGGYNNPKTWDITETRPGVWEIVLGSESTINIAAESREEALATAAELKEDTPGNTVPDAPFKSSWPELTLKRIARYAADNGFDRIAWASTPEQVAKIEGWGPLFFEKDGKYFIKGDRKDTNVTGIVERYTKGLGYTAGKLFKKYGVKASRDDIVNTGEVESTLVYEGPTYTADQLRRKAATLPSWEGRYLEELAENLDQGIPWEVAVTEVVDSEVLEVLGGKVTEQTPPNSNTANVIDLTPEMKSGVQAGQPLFRERRLSEGRQKRDYKAELTAAGVPEADAAELAQFIESDLQSILPGDVDGFIADVIKEFGKPTSESKPPKQTKEVKAAVEKEAKKIIRKVEKSAKELADEAYAEALEAFKPGRVPKPRNKYLLKLLMNNQLALISDNVFGRDTNPVRRIADLLEQRRTAKARHRDELAVVPEELREAERAYMSGSAEVRKDGNLLKVSRKKQQQIWEDFVGLAHDSTMAQVHPDKPLDDEAHKHLGKNAMNGKWGKEQHPKLAARYEALPDDLKVLFAKTRDVLTETQNKIGLEKMRVILKAIGHDDVALAKRFFEGADTPQDRAKVGDIVAQHIKSAGELTKLAGPYFNLVRRGDWVVQGTYKITVPSNGKKIADNVVEFKSKDDAEEFAKKQDLRPTVNSVIVDTKTGETFFTDDDGTEVKATLNDPDAEQRWRVTVQNRHVEFFNSKKEAQRAAKELREAGVEVKDVEARRFERDAANGDMLSDQMRALASTLEAQIAYKNLTPTEKSVIRNTLNEASLRFLSSTRIQSNRLPRRYVQGASKDLVLNTMEYIDSASGYLAKLDTQLKLEEAMRQMEQAVSLLGGRGQGLGTSARNIANEVSARVLDVDYDQGTLAPIANRMMMYNFISHLASPMYSVLQTMQVGMLTLPKMAAEYGELRTTGALAKAYYDIGAARRALKGVGATAMAVVGSKTPGRTYVDDVKGSLKDANEKKLIDDLVDLGVIDADAGFEVNRLTRKGSVIVQGVDATLDYFGSIARQAPQAIEAINRTVTALATFRLEMAKHGNYEKAKRAAQEMTELTQFNLSSSNAAPIFQNLLGRVLLQFKKYGQNVYFLLGRELGRAIRPMNKGDRVKGIKSIAYLLATHQVMAGFLGLPWEPVKVGMMLFNALGLTDMEWDDFENLVQEFVKELLGDEEGDATEAFAFGLPRLLDMNLSPRVGLSDLLLFGEPGNMQERDSVRSWLFALVAGPSSSSIQDGFDAVNAIEEGKFLEGFEKLVPPKVISDTVRAARELDEGKFDVSDAVMRAIGVQSARQARIQDKRGDTIDARTKVKQERKKIINDWLDADTAAERAKVVARMREYNRSAGKRDQLSVKFLRRISENDRRQYEE